MVNAERPSFLVTGHRSPVTDSRYDKNPLFFKFHAIRQT
jgi:hypothetical protein